jgi:hypothetical protein
MPMPRELTALMTRFNALGRLLPDDGSLDDEHVRAEARVVLAEMAKVKAAIDAYLDKACAEREAAS